MNDIKDINDIYNLKDLEHFIDEYLDPYYYCRELTIPISFLIKRFGLLNFQNWAYLLGRKLYRFSEDEEEKTYEIKGKINWIDNVISFFRKSI
ncbi:MAG: hypothetical protein AABY22_15115 [Nanoarchaeota archaeon]